MTKLELEEEVAGLEDTVISMGHKLSEIVNAIRGEPPEDTLHSTHDAVELVKNLVARLKLLAEYMEITEFAYEEMGTDNYLRFFEIRKELGFDD